MPTFPAFVMMKFPPAELLNWKTFPVVLDPMTVRTFAAAAGVALNVAAAVALTVPTVMFGVPERPPAVPPTLRLAAEPVKPVPGPENCVEALTVVPETVDVDVTVMTLIVATFRVWETMTLPA
jgi:hypothetical protein